MKYKDGLSLEWAMFSLAGDISGRGWHGGIPFSGGKYDLVGSGRDWYRRLFYSNVDDCHSQALCEDARRLRFAMGHALHKDDDCRIEVLRSEIRRLRGLSVNIKSPYREIGMTNHDVAWWRKKRKKYSDPLDRRGRPKSKITGAEENDRRQ